MTEIIVNKWGAVTSLQGDVRACLQYLPAGSVHVAITSPPYWALRSYLAKDHPLKALELGSEPTPELFIENLVGVFGELRRVLRDDGSCFVNLGDTYGAGGSDAGSRVGIPERFALAMVADGWLWRDSIIWHKLSPMPASLNGTRFEKCRIKLKSQTFPPGFKDSDKPDERRIVTGLRADLRGTNTVWADCPGCDKCRDTGGYILRRGSWRTTPAHEMIFMFSKSMGYFADAEAAREPAAQSTIDRNQYSRILPAESLGPDYQCAMSGDHEFTGSTRNPRSVWTIPPEYYGGAHYAAFPTGLPRRIIEVATSSKGCCPTCGACWARVVDRSETINRTAANGEGNGELANGLRFGDARSDSLGLRATCSCPPADPTPCSVLDPFGGTGTTAVAAIDAGRRAILCELNPDYVTQQRERLDKAAPLFTFDRDDLDRD